MAATPPIADLADPLVPYYHSFQTQGYHISYVKIGHGPIPIFTFPGIMGPLKSSFIPLATLMLLDPVFCSKYTFYGWDQPGYFRSKPPRRALEDISFQKDVQLAYALLKTLSHEKFTILGYSGGSQTALLFSLQHPEMVNRLLLLGGWDRFEEEDIKLNRWYRDVTNVTGPFAAMLEAEFEGKRDMMLEHWYAWHDMIMHQYANQDKVTWLRRYDNFNIPTLIVWGKRDLIVPYRQTKDLHEAIKHSRLEIMPKAPHNAHFIFPDEFYKILTTFLEEKICKQNVDSRNI